MKQTRFLVLLAVTSLIATNCGSGSDEGPPFEVSSAVVSHPTTRDISVWAPETDGSWPVVYALHGRGGSRQDLAETAIALARQGVVVFAADYRSSDAENWEQDAECGYRYMLSIAEDYGGDLDQPVTSVGYSLGATLVLEGGLNDATYGPGGSYDKCFSGAPRADVTVAVAGCHYEYQGQTFDLDPNNSRWTNEETDLILVAGTDDPVCEAWQSQDATAAFRSAGYDANLVEIDGANHFTLIFHDLVDGEWLTLPDEAAGMEAVRAILDAIGAAQR
jgi:alpha-beta hydrolase superfamily lysophospholipase